MLIDMHIHSSIGSLDSNMTVHDIIKHLHPKIEAIVITDHDYLPESLKPVEIKGVIVLRGTEITTRQGHLLVYGIEELPKVDSPVEEVIDLIHAQDGIAVAAHPFRMANSLGENVFDVKLDGLEINGKSSAKNHRRVRKAAVVLDLPLIGGSDAHRINGLNTFVSHCRNDVYNIDDLVNLVKKKAIYPGKIF